MEKNVQEYEGVKKALADMLNGHLSVEEIVEIVRKPKDKNRFEILLEIRQAIEGHACPVLQVHQDTGGCLVVCFVTDLFW